MAPETILLQVAAAVDERPEKNLIRIKRRTKAKYKIKMKRAMGKNIRKKKNEKKKNGGEQKQKTEKCTRLPRSGA